jgi:hypothetical protein
VATPLWPGDFRRWKDHDAYKQSFERVMRDLKVPPAVAVSGLLQAARRILWIMSAMRSLSCVPRFLSLNALPIRTRSVAV